MVGEFYCLYLASIFHFDFLSAAFSLYVILSYGYEYFFHPNYTIIYQNSSVTKVVGEKVELYCRADAHWEWCRSKLYKNQTEV